MPEPDDRPTDQPEPAEKEPQTPNVEATDAETSESEAADAEATGAEAEVESRYETTPTGGHRVIRRTVRRSSNEEHIVETITEDFAPSPYQAPESAHPAPVG